ncbi:MAG: FG-GAP-like repeat-containing protein, partial [Gemmatimonadota bacterium]|nr:FG-GAP-like repeat-containing protein [Gemmatimonadota bacterium]
FFEELLASEWGRPAEAMAASRARLVSENPNAYRVSGARRFMYFGRSFLGFPTLSLHRGEPGTLRVDHPTVLSARRAPFPVRVTGAEDGLPVEGARVCLSKGDEDYAFGTTDETGRVLFQFRPEHHGVADLVVTAPGRVPYDAALPVNASASAHLVSAGWRGVGATGSGGEWRVQLAVENAGRVASPGGSVSLSAAGEGVVVMDGAGSVSVVAPGDTAWTTAFTLRSAACATDGDRLPVLLDGEPGSGLTSEPYLLSAELAEVVIAGMEIRGGRILPLLENRGSGSSGVLFASLTVAAGEGSVAEGEVTAGRLAPGEEVLLEPGFSASGPSGVTFRLDVECSRGTRVTRIVNLSPPAGASAASSSPRPESAVLSWTSGPSGDTAGYRILLPGRRGWRDAFGHLLRQGSVAEIPLPAGSRSAFAVIAVDSSGLASPDTAFGEARSNDPLLPGWPQRLDSVVGPTPLVPADLDGDGLPEIVLGSMWPSNAVHVFRASGSEWVDGDADPATAGHFGTTGGRVNAAPLVVDLDGDGRGEIVAASYDGFVYAWRTDGANAAPDPVPGWPVFHAATGLRSSPVAADVDGDGLPEIVTVAHDGRIRALEADGSLVPGWPRVTGRGGTGSTPAVADLDGDGRDDVVVSGTDSLLYALSGSGEDLPGWPVAMGAEGLASPVLADLDGDGTLEVIAPDEDGRIHAFRLSDGDGDGVADSCPGWPVSGASSEATIPSPAVADLDGDGFPEVIANANRRVCAWRADGTPLPGWPIPAAGNAANSPVVADLDGDGRLDVLVGRTDGTLTAHAPDGTVVPGWPWSFTEIPWATPAVADMDGDGDLDVLIGADDGRVRIVDAPGSAAYGTAPWPVYHGGADLAGVYRPLSDATALPPAGTSDSPAVLSLASPFPNPFRDQTLLRFALPETGPVTLTLHDVAGRRVACLLDERLLPSGDHSVVWDGHAARGGRTAPGVYFVRLALRGESESVRIVHLW